MREENYYYKSPLLVQGNVKDEMLRNCFNDYSCNLEYPYRQVIDDVKSIENNRCMNKKKNKR